MAIYRELMSASFALERPPRVGYLGPRGSFSHEAAVTKFGASVEYEPLGAYSRRVRRDGARAYRLWRCTGREQHDGRRGAGYAGCISGDRRDDLQRAATGDSSESDGEMQDGRDRVGAFQTRGIQASAALAGGDGLV